MELKEKGKRLKKTQKTEGRGVCLSTQHEPVEGYTVYPPPRRL